MAKTNIVFSPSSLDLFLMCPARYNMGHNLRRGLPISEKSKSLDYGGLVHKGLDVYFNQLAEGLHFNDRLHNCLMKIREASANPDESNLEIDDLQPLLSAVEESCDFWRYEDEMLEILAIETPFDFILYEDDYVRIIISGKIDLLANLRGIGQQASYENLPYDHKTFQRTFPTDRMNNQFIAYCAATGSNYLRVNKIGLQKTLKPEEKFLRIPLSYDPLYIEEWKHNTIAIILNQYLSCIKSGIWPMNFTSCRKFGRLCEFAVVCDSSGNDSKQFKLEANFIEREPWDKYKEGEE